MRAWRAKQVCGLFGHEEVRSGDGVVCGVGLVEVEVEGMGCWDWEMRGWRRIGRMWKEGGVESRLGGIMQCLQMSSRELFTHSIFVDHLAVHKLL